LPRRILVVEGYEPLRQMLRRMLESRRYRVLVASGPEAFEPGLDGFEALLELHGIAPELPIIVTSAGDRARGFRVLGDALRLGATGALPKPFRLLQLVELVSKVLATNLDPG
jgi:CheY-like chemotaxis protein